MKKISFILLLLTLLAPCLRAQEVDTLSTRDIAKNYRVDTLMLDDTAFLSHYVAKLQLDFEASAKKCAEIKKNASQMIYSLEQEYGLQDSLIWLDSTVVIADYATLYKQRLQDLATAAEQLTRHYLDLEWQRIAEEKRIAEERARAEALRLQQLKEAQADTLKLLIESRHRTISASCDGSKGDSKIRIKELKDIYYAYLTIYNRYELTATKVDDPFLHSLNRLSNFQQSILDSVLGPDSYQHQAENFKNSYKTRCGKEHADAFKSYSKLFKQISIPVTFTNIQEYEQYLQQYKDILQIQSLYTQSVELREQITATSNSIVALYGKKYKEVGSTYKYTVETMDFTPDFTTLDGGTAFIQYLNTFMQVQQHYLNNYQRLETIELRGDTIANMCIKKNYDIVVAYRELHDQTDFVPSFKTLGGAIIYERSLDEFESLQQAYIYVARLRSTITQNDEKILDAKGVDHVLTKGYKLIKDQINFRPYFRTAASADIFLKSLSTFIINQEEFLIAIEDQHTIEANNTDIKSAAKPYTNLQKAYNKVAKSYQFNAAIVSIDNLHTYRALQRQLLDAQSRTKDILNGATCRETNELLKKVSDIDKIKLIMQIQ